MKRLATVAVIAACVLGVAYCQQLRTVKVTVVDEDETPIEGVNTTVTFLAYGAGKTVRKNGVTNNQGVYQVSGSTSGRIHVRVKKEGYYHTDSGRLSRKEDHDVTYVLRKKKNPIPLYARKYSGKVPGIGKSYGFDFEKGDWVGNQGDGKRTDLYFKVDIVNDEKGNRGGKLSITFPEKKEGIAVITEANGYLDANQLVMPHQASLGPYQKQIGRVESGYQNTNKPRNTSYFMRTRANHGKAGETIFNYTKFQNGIGFSVGGGGFLEEPYRSRHPDEYGAISFTYYFNPTPNDRNLEFDPGRNLFKDLDSTEQVHDP